MKLFWAFLSTFFLFSSCAWAGKKSMIWEIQGKKNKVFLVGSIHLLPKKFYPLHPFYEKIWKKAKVLVVEANPSREDPVHIAQWMARYGKIQSKKELADYLSPDGLQKLKKHLKGMGLSYRSFRKLKPWLVGVTLTQIQMMKEGLQPHLGLDAYFLSKAKKRKLPVKELESTHYQLSLFSKFSPKTQSLFLASSLLSSAETMKFLQLLFKAWKEGDTLQIETAILEPLKNKMKVLFQKLFVNRNRLMAQKIARYLQSKKNMFVVVGAGHLVGNKSIQTFLLKKGFRAKQLPLTPSQ